MLASTLLMIQDNLLSIVMIMITLIFIYNYLIEKGKGSSLTQRYRNSLFETQSKIFLNATQYLIAGNKDLAIKEFMSAVDINRETLDTYFALGRLFRGNGEIEKAISIHRSLIARENISESVRLSALKELAIDFDKGGFLDKAIETYRDVLKLNRDQPDVVKSICRIYEDIGDWDQALNFRLMLSKVSRENQSETLSHILIEKAKIFFEKENYKDCQERLEDALRFAPSISAKILQLKLYLVKGKMEDAKTLLLEVLREHPLFASFLFLSLDEVKGSSESISNYLKNLSLLKHYFLNFQEQQFDGVASIFLVKLRLLKKEGQNQEALQKFQQWLDQNKIQGDVMKIEYIKLLIEMGEKEVAIVQMKDYLNSVQSSSTRHYCSQCGFNSDDVFWRCPQCHEWETIQFRWKV